MIKQGGQVTVLAVVSDGWPEPAAAASRFRLLEPQVGAVIRVPFMPGLRAGRRPGGRAAAPRGMPGPGPDRGDRQAHVPAPTQPPGDLTMLLLALAVHHASMASPGLPPLPGRLAVTVPNPAPQAPPGLARTVNTLLAWWKWLALIAGVFGLTGCGAMMAIGRRNRHSLAADGATGIPWVLAGLTLIALSSGIVGVFL